MKYRILEAKELVPEIITGDIKNYLIVYYVQVKFLFFWVDIKRFCDKDIDWAKQCAEELYEKLTEEI